VGSEASNRQVLIVDDNRDLADNIAEILEVEGYTTAIAYGPQEALEMATDMQCDAALLDIRMPGMDGVDLHAALRRVWPLARFVLMTGYASDARVAKALADGACDVLLKPVPIDRLLLLLPAP
jgi:CheY-like chemotaxis protein